VIVTPIYLVLIAAAIGTGLAIGDTFPAFYAGDVSQWLNEMEMDFAPEGPLHFSWLPLLIAIWIGKVFSMILERMTTSVKVIYFTIFYMRITHLDDILPDIRDELDGFLQMQGDPDGPLVGETR
jgi:hypothetical protein